MVLFSFFLIFLQSFCWIASVAVMLSEVAAIEGMILGGRVRQFIV